MSKYRRIWEQKRQDRMRLGSHAECSSISKHPGIVVLPSTLWAGEPIYLPRACKPSTKEAPELPSALLIFPGLNLQPRTKLLVSKGGST